jgi:hypothetical protein
MKEKRIVLKVFVLNSKKWIIMYESWIKFWSSSSSTASGMSEFGYGFASFRNSVFGKFTWEEELDSRLDWSSGHGFSSTYSDKSGGFTAEFIESVVHESVHDIHSSSGDTNFWVNLFKDFVYIESPALISTFSSWFGGRFLFSSWHFDLWLLL